MKDTMHVRGEMVDGRCQASHNCRAMLFGQQVAKRAKMGERRLALLAGKPDRSE